MDESMDCVGGHWWMSLSWCLMWTDRQTDRGSRGTTEVHTVISFVKSQQRHAIVSSIFNRASCVCASSLRPSLTSIPPLPLSAVSEGSKGLPQYQTSVSRGNIVKQQPAVPQVSYNHTFSDLSKTAIYICLHTVGRSQTCISFMFGVTTS